MANRWTRICALAVLLSVLGSSCSATQPTPAPSGGAAASAPPEASLPVASTIIEVSQTGALMTGRGQSVQITADARDEHGSALSVTWISSDPAAVSVSADGLVTSNTDLGGALIVAEAGDDFVAIPVLIAEPVAGAVLVSDTQVAGAPVPVEDPDGLPENGDHYRVTLRDADPPPAGSILLATGSTPLAGRVVSTAETTAEEMEVEYELVPLPMLLARYDFALDIPIDPRDAGLTPSATSRQFAAVSGSEPAGRTKFDAVYEAEKKAEFKKGPLTCSASVSAKFKSTDFDIKATSNLTLQFEGRKEVADASTPEHTKVVLTGPVALDIFGGLRAEAGFEGSAGCEIKKYIPVPLGGILAALLAVSVPLGLAAGAEGKVKAVEVELGPKGHLGTNVAVGFQCDTNNCWAVTEHTPDANNGVTFESKVNILGDMRLEASVGVSIITGLGATVLGNNFSLVDAKLGPVESLNLALSDAQAADKAYASAYDMKVAGSVTPGEDLKTAISRLFGGEVTLDLSAKYESDPLVESPKGRLSADKARVQVDHPVNLRVDLDAKTVDYLQFRPNVKEIRIARLKDNALKAIGTVPVSASGQTRFELTWTPDTEFIGMNELVAFVVTEGLPPAPLEVVADSTTYVEVVDACIGDIPSPAPPAPSPAPGQPPPGATLPPPDPCIADGTVTLADGFHVDDMDGDIPTRTNTVIVTTMQAELEQDEFDPTLFHSTGGSWSMEYAYDNWADRTYNGGADGCILTEQASASLAGAWDDQSFLDLSYDPETLFATLSFAITPPGDVTQSTHCLNSNTGTFPAADLLVRAGVYVAQGHREGDRIVFDFNEERTDQPLSTATRILRFQGRLSVSPASQ